MSGINHFIKFYCCSYYGNFNCIKATATTPSWTESDSTVCRFSIVFFQLSILWLTFRLRHRKVIKTVLQNSFIFASFFCYYHWRTKMESFFLKDFCYLISLMLNGFFFLLLYLIFGSLIYGSLISTLVFIKTSRSFSQSCLPNSSDNVLLFF